MAIVDGLNRFDSPVRLIAPVERRRRPAACRSAHSDRKTVSLGRAQLGTVPLSGQHPQGGRKPINAKGETVRDLPTFREAYRKRRCIMPDTVVLRLRKRSRASGLAALRDQ